jgi:hypothetical protein
VTAHRVIGSGLGFDIASAPSTASVRAWSASPYKAVNVYFSGSQRYDTTQAGLDADWVTTVLSNGWSLIPTVVDLQAPSPCYGGKKQKMSTDPTTAASQGTAAAQAAHTDLVNLGIGGTVAYLDLEPFDTSKSAKCAPAVLAFVHAFVKTLHQTGEKAGIYVHWQRGAPTFVKDYDKGSTYRPDAIWVAQWNGVATAATAVIGDRWPHHRIHQYWSDDPTQSNPKGTPETYGAVKLSVDRDAIDGDVVAAKSVSVSGYNVSAPGTGLKERAQPNTSSTVISTLADKSAISITCQATGQSVNGDIVWDKLSDGSYVSDIYTTTTGRNSFTGGIARCDTTAPTVSLALPPPPLVKLAPTINISWSAADAPDPDGNPNAESRGISTSTLRYRFASWHGGFGGWHTRTTTALSSTLSITAGYNYCVQVMARDLSGNASPWSPTRCFVRPLDDRSMSAGSGWTRTTRSHFYFHTATKASSKGRVLSRSNATLRRVGVVATSCAKCGSVRVYVGKTYVGSINLDSPSTRYRQVFLLSGFTLRSGTIKIRTTSSKLVQIDGLVVSRS